MRVVIISKRKMKKALSRNVEQHGMSRVLLLELSGKCGFVKKGGFLDYSQEVKFKGWGCSWWVPKHFIGKVIK